MSLIFLLIWLSSFVTFCFDSDCGSKRPGKPSDCHNRWGENSSNYCCMMTSDDASPFCKWINRTDYLTSNNTYMFNDTLFDMQCELNPKPHSFGTICGPENPENKTVCFDSAPDEANSTCCLYQNNNTKFCFWMEKDYLESFYTYDEKIVQCSGFNLRLSFLLIAVTILIS